MNKKDTFIYLEPYTHVETCEDNILIYNQITGFILQESRKEIIEIVKRLNKENKVCVAKVNSDELNNKYVKTFIQDLKKHYLGDIIRSDKLPVQVLPIPKIEYNYDNQVDCPNILSNLLELTFHLNSYNQDNYPNKFLNLYKQFYSNYSDRGGYNLPLYDIVNLVNECKKGALYKINILGGNVLEYENYKELVKYMNDINCTKDYYLYYKDNISILELKHVDQNSRFKVLIDFPLEENCIKKILQCITELPNSVTIIYIVENENDLENAEDLSRKYSFSDVQFNPYYNGNNLDFFKKTVFIDNSDIIDSKPTKDELFRNQIINSHYLGKLTILNNGDIYSNPNSHKVGTIKDSIYEIVHKVLKCKSSWRLLRNDVEPCKCCSFRLFCPPISNYEYVIGQYNLCTIKN